MKPAPILLAAALAASAAPEEAPRDLAEPDRQAALDLLAEITGEIREARSGRHGGAAGTFHAAAASPETALEFWLKCVEKVDFEERNKDSQDFREWRRRQDRRLDDPAFALALQHQLRWLSLALRAAESDKREELTTPAIDILNSLKANAEVLQPRRAMIEEDVFGTVFAKAYGLEGMKVRDWPGAPLPLEPVFDQAILPALREAGEVGPLRAAWLKRIEFEDFIAERMSRQAYDEKGPAPPDYRVFVAETMPELRWKMELDLFDSGNREDKREALPRLMEHLRQHAGHRKAGEWAATLKRRLEGPDPNEQAPPPDSQAG